MPGYNDLNIGMDFINNPIMPGQPQQPFQPINSPQQMPSYQINTALSQPDPVITGPKKSLFTVIPDDSGRNTKPLPIPDDMAENARQARRISRASKKEEVAEINPGEIIRSDNAQKELSTMYNYAQTTALLGDTLGQVDMLASELKNEFDNVMGNRTLKNKYMILTNLSESMSQLLNTKTTIIREINNSISKSIDIDYKKEKDRLAAEGAANDDKYMMDLYNAFVNSSPFANGGNTVPLGPSMSNAAVSSFDGSGIIRSPIQNNAGNNSGPVDVGYLNYLSRVTPEQNAMALESDPNIKTVVVYDQSNGNKFFQVMNMATGQVVPNVPVMDNRFLEDTFIDLNNGIAKNNNLHMTYPLVTINSGSDSNISNNY